MRVFCASALLAGAGCLQETFHPDFWSWFESHGLWLAGTRVCEFRPGHSENFGTNDQQGGVHLMILELESVPVRLDARVRVNSLCQGSACSLKRLKNFELSQLEVPFESFEESERSVL